MSDNGEVDESVSPFLISRSPGCMLQAKTLSRLTA